MVSRHDSLARQSNLSRQRGRGYKWHRRRRSCQDPNLPNRLSLATIFSDLPAGDVVQVRDAQSSRSTSIGSRRAARIAGNSEASAETASTIVITLASVGGSVAETP